MLDLQIPHKEESVPLISRFHNLRVDPKQLFVLAHLRCTRAVGTSYLKDSLFVLKIGVQGYDNTFSFCHVLLKLNL